MPDLLYLLHDPACVRARCAAVARAVQDDRSGHWRLDGAALDRLAHRLAQPVPGADAGGHGLADRVGPEDPPPTPLAEFETRLQELEPRDAARIRVDRAFVSAWLSGEPGDVWRFTDRPVQTLALPVQRQSSDDLLALLGQASATAPVADGPAPPMAVPPDPTSGLGGLAGLDAAVTRGLLAGAFSSDPRDPLRVDAQALKRLDVAALRSLFQAHAVQPLVGLEGRAHLLRSLGEALQAQADAIGADGRPSQGLETLYFSGSKNEVSANQLLRDLLSLAAGAWPGGRRVQGLAVGDVWPSRWAGAQTGAGMDPTTGGWVPLHHLAQLVVRRLAPTVREAGWCVGGLDALTSGSDPGLINALIAAGALVPRHVGDLGRAWPVGHELVLEARALTVTLLDTLRARQPSGTQWPALEAALRRDLPPAPDADLVAGDLRLRIAADPVTDGTVF